LELVVEVAVSQTIEVRFSKWFGLNNLKIVENLALQHLPEWDSAE
jgi:hypothetical protein